MLARPGQEQDKSLRPGLQSLSQHIMPKTMQLKTIAVVLLVGGVLLGCGTGKNQGSENSTSSNGQDKQATIQDQTIQKRVDVTEKVSGKFLALPQVAASINTECLKKSIDNAKFDSLLAQGIRVITSSPWESPNSITSDMDATYAAHLLNSSCIGTTYILEGPASALSSL